MKIIVFAGTKGGSGRSTLCWNVAIEAARAGHGVYLCDRDPQKTTEELWRKRARMPDLFREDNPLLLENVDTLSGAKRRLAESGFERDYLIVDTPGSLMPIIRDAVAVADCVALPVQPSPKDVLAQEAIAEVIGEFRKSAQTILVLNRVDGRDNLADQAERKLGPADPQPYRQDQAAGLLPAGRQRGQGRHRDRQGGGRGDRRPVGADSTCGEEDRWQSR